MLVLEDGVVHLPKLALRPGGLGCLGGMLGVRMALPEGKVAKDEAKLIAQSLLQVLHDGIRHAAVRALVVAILDECDGCLVRTGDVVVLRDGRMEGAHGRASDAAGWGAFDLPLLSAPGSDSSALKMPSAPGFTSTGER